MSRIDRSQFNQALQQGVNLNDSTTVQKLTDAGVNVAELKAKADVDNDGWIKGGPELETLFKHVDAFDRNGSSASFENTGKAGADFTALVNAAGGTVPVSVPKEGRFAAQIVQTGRDRAAAHRESYGINATPTSPNPLLSGNRRPNESKLEWLKGKNKCNQFVGDTLTQAGVKAPTWAMKDGTMHYASAEKWPTFSNLFERITDPSQIRPGDVIVKDYPGAGESSAHVEIITGTGPFSSVGAHWDGAYEQNTNDWLKDATYQPDKRAFKVEANDVYILRPKVAL